MGICMTTDKEKIILNVGGTHFETTRLTLSSQVYFKRLIEYCPHNHVIFIDRDGKHFRHILNFLRNNKIVWPEKEHEIQELKPELQFYCIDIEENNMKDTVSSL